MNLERYHPVSRVLHWLIAGLIICQYVIAKLAERADSDGEVVRQLALLANHKSIGMTVLLLVLFRLLVRWVTTVPVYVNAMPAWQSFLSASVHWLLYGLIIALPISGWLMSSATDYSVSWFNLFAIPDLLNADEA